MQNHVGNLMQFGKRLCNKDSVMKGCKVMGVFVPRRTV